MESMYKITIEKIEEETVTVKGDWKIVGEKPYTEDDMKTSYDSESYKGEAKNVYGYLDDKQVIRNKEVQVLEQTVENIDLVAVIKAINGIEGN